MKKPLITFLKSEIEERSKEIFFFENYDKLIKEVYPKGLFKEASEFFSKEINELYYAEIMILPIDELGEQLREIAFNVLRIGRYGAYEFNFTYENEIYNVIIKNND